MEVEQLLMNTEKVRLEDFELLKVLGRGSFGKVMLVKYKRDGKKLRDENPQEEGHHREKSGGTYQG